MVKTCSEVFPVWTDFTKNWAILKQGISKANYMIINMKESSSESVLQKPIEKINLLQLAFGDGTTKKAFFSALVVGSILTGINHGDMILSGEYPPWLKVMLIYFVPYCVTTWGAITGKLTSQRKMR